MSRYALFSHDGFGLGHVRRNCLVAEAILDRDPLASVTVISGVPCRLPWTLPPAIRLVSLPPLVKDKSGQYAGREMSTEAAVAARERIFAQVIASCDPEVIVIDRHPFGVAGELRAGLLMAHRRGARLALGLRDILDEPAAMRLEMAGAGWSGVPELFHDAIVYGSRLFCDHLAEYRLPLQPTYCGWVTEPLPAVTRERDLLAIAAGGGGDGKALFELGLDLLRRRPAWRGELALGPLADPGALAALRGDEELGRRVRVETQNGCGPLFGRASAILQMAGYNSTLEALAAGQRPILLPRRSPRREQAIRAQRLASLGLADVVDDDASADEVDWLLDRQRQLRRDAITGAGLHFDGARHAADRLRLLAQRRRCAA